MQRQDDINKKIMRLFHADKTAFATQLKTLDKSIDIDDAAVSTASSIKIKMEEKGPVLIVTHRIDFQSGDMKMIDKRIPLKDEVAEQLISLVDEKKEEKKISNPSTASVSALFQPMGQETKLSTRRKLVETKIEEQSEGLLDNKHDHVEEGKTYDVLDYKHFKNEFLDTIPSSESKSILLQNNGEWMLVRGKSGDYWCVSCISHNEGKFNSQKITVIHFPLDITQLLNENKNLQGLLPENFVGKEKALDRLFSDRKPSIPFNR